MVKIRLRSDINHITFHHSHIHRTEIDRYVTNPRLINTLPIWIAICTGCGVNIEHIGGVPHIGFQTIAQDAEMILLIWGLFSICNESTQSYTLAHTIIQCSFILQPFQLTAFAMRFRSYWCWLWSKIDLHNHHYI